MDMGSGFRGSGVPEVPEFRRSGFRTFDAGTPNLGTLEPLNP